MTARAAPGGGAADADAGPGARRTPPLGPRLLAGGAEFSVWAPRAASLAVRHGGRTVPLAREERGVWRGTVPGARAGDDYLLVLDGRLARPDPRSRLQPQGPHGPSRLVDLGGPPARFAPPALRELVFYELHCGTFTPEGTFDAAAARLGHLVDLGVTAVEVMPVAAFPGRRGWGYDGVDLYAVHAAYGGPAAFRRFVDACHAVGLAVVLDVVYNHLGPDGNYLAEFGPYFTDRYRTPWGPALNYDGPGSDFVRDFVLDNAEQWVAGYGVDGLRLDAVHEIHDRSSVHLLEALADRVHGRAPGGVLVAESDLNQPALVGSYGIDTQWADDFHHAVHAALTGERDGWYRGYLGLGQLAKALTRGWVFTGQYGAGGGRAPRPPGRVRRLRLVRRRARPERPGVVRAFEARLGQGGRAGARGARAAGARAVAAPAPAPPRGPRPRQLPAGPRAGVGRRGAAAGRPRAGRPVGLAGGRRRQPLRGAAAAAGRRARASTAADHGIGRILGGGPRPRFSSSW